MFVMIGVVWIVFCIACTTFAWLLKKLSYDRGVRAMKAVSVGLAVLFALYAIIGRVHNVWVMVIPMVFLSFSNLCFDQLTGVYFSKHFPGRQEAFGIFKQIQNAVAGVVVIAYISMTVSSFRMVHAVCHAILAVWLVKVF